VGVSSDELAAQLFLVHVFCSGKLGKDPFPLVRPIRQHRLHIPAYEALSATHEGVDLLDLLLERTSYPLQLVIELLL